MSRARALLLSPAGRPHQWVAAAPHLLLAVKDWEAPLPIPRAYAHCAGLVEWQTQWAFAFDLAAWLERSVAERPAYWALLGIPPGLAVASPRPLPVVALALAERPGTIEVDDEDACPLPRPEAAWAAVSVSCFRHQGVAVPILAVEKLLQAVPAATAPD